MSKTLGQNVEHFLKSLKLNTKLPTGFEVLDVYADTEVQNVLHEFCTRYYSGSRKRIGMWGINPGRFGAGTTGLPFTDPPRLTSQLGIDSSIEGRPELSAEFISMVIEAYGGPTAFYNDVYVTGFSPLGYVKESKNINFYDDKDFLMNITPEILTWVKKQLSFAVRSDACIVLGAGKLKSFVEKSVKPVVHLGEVIYLEHPRYVMQYKRSAVPEFVEKYVKTIKALVL